MNVNLYINLIFQANNQPGNDICGHASATCILIPSGKYQFSCDCGKNKYWNENQLQCNDINACFDKKCDLHQKCVLNDDGTTKCECFSDYEMKSGKCQPKNYCNDQDAHLCGSQSWCVQVGVGRDNAVCGCKPGWHPDSGNPLFKM